MRLSKSKYIRGLQCPRGLWLEVHRPSLARYGREAMLRFGRGRDFEYAIKAQYPNGIDISALLGRQVDDYPALTAQLLAEGKTLFEAGFAYDGVLVLADVVVPLADGAVEVYEVKSGSRLSDTYVNDAAVQYYVISHQYSVSCFSVVHADEEGSRTVNLTSELRSRQWSTARNISYMKEILLHSEPLIEVGPQCEVPYSCPFRHHCEHAQVQLALF